MLTEFVRERLARLLAENGPRRARPQETPTGDIFAAARARLDQPSPLDAAPSDDGEGEDIAVRDIDDWPEAPPRRSFGRAHLGVVVALLLVGLACAGWAVLRARPVAIAGPPVVRATAADARVPSASSAGTPRASETPAPLIMVHVLGAVQKPGVVTLPERSRVRDAISAAGGLQRGAQPGQLNLAQVLADGQQVIIATKNQPSSEVRDGSGAAQQSNGDDSTSPAGAVVDLNSATQSQLEELPGVGPVTAGKIVAWRQEHGRFSRVEELQEIDGIGPKTFAQIAPRARV